ncbi:hypothetical protein [Sabulibacter ruber]|uniref:hypothetical protein n=1 Tax=Sabulibacter ruber TaxID=2811901 RepID=UPI001A9656D5|nr:hypothetical protein [Sabulibacter ruber]
MLSTLKWTLILSLLTPILLITVVFLAGGGHGWYGPAFLLFPWASMPMVFMSPAPEFIIISLGLLQYPAYGLLVDFNQGTPRFRSTLISLVSLHLLFAMLLLLFSNETWS